MGMSELSWLSTEHDNERMIMMKRVLPCLLLITVCISVSIAGYDDGVISEGEYEYGVRIENSDTLLVQGGGGR